MTTKPAPKIQLGPVLHRGRTKLCEACRGLESVVSQVEASRTSKKKKKNMGKPYGKTMGTPWENGDLMGVDDFSGLVKGNTYRKASSWMGISMEYPWFPVKIFPTPIHWFMGSEAGKHGKTWENMVFHSGSMRWLAGILFEKCQWTGDFTTSRNILDVMGLTEFQLVVHVVCQLTIGDGRQFMLERKHEHQREALGIDVFL